MTKMATKFTKPKLLSEFLDICKKNKYFDATVKGNSFCNVEFLKHSSKLQANIERQWLFKSKDIENSLKTYSNAEFMEYGENLSLLDKYAIVRKKDRLAKTIPFGLIDIQNGTSPTDFDIDDTSVDIQLGKDTKSLTCWYLVNDKQSQEYFYRIQRLRKIWWMKYAANPGRFVISEVKQDDEKNKKSISIRANYPFGSINIENVEVKPLNSIETLSEINKSSDLTKVIKTTVVSEIAVIESVLDSIDAGDFGEMCLHRKIAPYQCVVYSISKDPDSDHELTDLIKYVSMLLQRSEISVLNSVECQFSEDSALDDKLKEVDAIGIPYGLILDEESLQTGFMKLRNRDTTLSETIHISYLIDYLPKIFQS